MSAFRVITRTTVAAQLCLSLLICGCQQKQPAPPPQTERSEAELDQEYRSLLAETGLYNGGSPTPPAQIETAHYGQLLQTAAGHGSVELLTRLLNARKEFGINFASDGRSLLHAAAAALNAHTSNLLLERGADPNPRDSLGRTPLHLTVSQVNGEVLARLLLSRGAQADVRDDQGMTPLLLAGPSCVKILIDKGADISASDNQGNGVLHWAVLRKSVPLVTQLIALEAPLEQRDSAGRTPLLLAAEKGDPAMVKLLLAAGAKADTTDDRGQTPLQAAERTGNRALQNLLRQQNN